MKFKVIWSPRSKEEFGDVLDYLESEFGKNAALKCLEDVESILESIAVFPYLFKAYQGQRIRKAVVHKNLSVFYAVTSDFIELLSFWDNRRNPKKLKL